MGIDPLKNYDPPEDVVAFLSQEMKLLDKGPLVDILTILNQLPAMFKKTLRELKQVLARGSIVN